MKKRNPYTLLDQAVAHDDRALVAAALARLTDHDKDLIVDCPAKKCLAPERKECVGTEEGVVHFGRRLKRLLLGGIR